MSVSAPTTDWTVVSAVNQMDFFNDQQTGVNGQGPSDIVGTLSNPGFYTGYSNGFVYFRVRLGETEMKQGNNPGPNFTGLFWIGIEANGDGKLDLFIGVNRQGSTSKIVFADAGSGLNNSPSTTTIANALDQFKTDIVPGSNYDYRAVNSTIDPPISNTDLNSNNKIDAFLSIRVPLFDVAGTPSLQGAMNTLASILVNEKSVVRYVIATATNINSLNQDLGGLPKTFDGTTTWEALGALTPKQLWTGEPPPPPDGTVPEASTSAMIALGLTAIATAARRRINHR